MLELKDGAVVVPDKRLQKEKETTSQHCLLSSVLDNFLSLKLPKTFLGQFSSVIHCIKVTWGNRNLKSGFVVTRLSR